MWNAISLGQDLNLCPFPTTITITPRAPILLFRRRTKKALNTRMCQKFCNILVTSNTIWHTWMLLLRLWMLIKHTGLWDAEIIWFSLSASMNSSFLSLPDFAWLLSYLQVFLFSIIWLVYYIINCIFIFCMTNVFGYFCNIMAYLNL